MANHENKHCPRCNAPFECKVGSILLCQCQGINFTDQERDYIRLTYPDCLCRNCLMVMKHEISTKAAQKKIRTILEAIKKGT
ncbi:cysteine-rich CWC family protein [Mucilaginibacter gossypiicola]|uniref:cysteine-rich CWC family protein n=1 Tax=Mucilaginibacter gossypiicola TaxID=551995 RepID=UPI000B81192D|nr:cysteine-rich CWC family protein [Mucilaginibacter gossypiicola]